MKRYISVILVLLLWALMLPGCKVSTPSTPGTTPQADVPATTTTSTDTPDPNPLVTVYQLTGCTYGDANAAFVYDDTCTLLEVSVDGEIVVAYTYDEQGNCLSYKNTFQGIDQTYDAQGNTLTDKTEEGHITNTYDEAGRCVSVERRSADGSLLSVTRYAYNEQGNLLSEALEQDGSICYEILHTYDEAGRHLTQTYCRDGQISDEGPSYVWAYDELGHLESENIYYGEAHHQGTLFLYDRHADAITPYLQWKSDGTMTQFSHFYDKEGNLTRYTESTTDAEGNRHSKEYTYEYNAQGNTLMHKYVDHTGEEQLYRWTYDESGLIMTGHTLTSSTESYEYTWAYTDSGKKAKEVRTGDAPYETIWEYDPQGRLLSVTRTGTGAYRETYVYDDFGNLIQRNHTADSVTTVTSYTYTALTVTKDLAAQIQAQQEEIFRHLRGEAIRVN